MNVIQCIQILLEEMTGSLDSTLNNTANRLKELKPDQEKDQAKLWEYRDNILAIWEETAIQVSNHPGLIQPPNLGKVVAYTCK